MTQRLALVALACALVFAGCDDSQAIDAGTDAGAPDAGPPPPFELSSAAFMEGQAVPMRNLCGPPLSPSMPGMNVSAPLTWTAGPAETMSYAVVIRDLSAGGLVHWAIYDISAATLSLPEDIPAGYEPGTPAGAKQAEIQGSGYFGYFGPCSGGRMNNYQWTVHALDAPALAGVSVASTENDVAAAIEAASIASATLNGTY